MLLEIIGAIILALIIYNALIYLIHLWNLKNYPPGPIPLPVIGNLHLLKGLPHVALADVGKQYGDVFSISFGMERVVVVLEIHPAREALISKSDTFAGRPNNVYTADLLSRGYKNIGFGDFGPKWKQARKFAHSALKLYGEGFGKAEALIIKESQSLRDRLRASPGEPTDVHHETGLAVLNIIASMVFGKQYERDDPEFKDILKFATLVFSGLAASDAVAFLPWLRFFPLDGLKRLKKGIAIRDPILRQNIQEHVKSFDGENVRDLTDALLKVYTDEQTDDSCDSSKSDYFEMTINDIFVGGTETTSTMIRWFILFMLYWPEYQDKIYEEVVRVIGTDRYPNYDERGSLHMWRAAINEGLRHSSLSTLGVAHKAMKDSTLGGQPVPKNTMVLINLWKLHHDEKFWKNPSQFYPERWLDENGKFTQENRTSFLPFGAGRRGCFGEILARVELFHILIRIICDFRIEKVGEKPLPSLRGVHGITLSPEPYKCAFIPRPGKPRTEGATFSKN